MKRFWLLLISTGLVGGYWSLMSGFWVDRTVDLSLNKAGNSATQDAVVANLRDAEQALLSHRDTVNSLGWLAPTPDWHGWKRMTASVQTLRWQAEQGLSEGSDEAEAAHGLRQAATQLPRISAATFSESGRMWTTFLLYAALGLTCVCGVSAFLSRNGD